MIKQLATFVVFAIIASLSVAGCTSNTNNTATSPAPPAHDAMLEKMVDAYKQEYHAYGNNMVRAWDVTWNNATSVTVLFTLIQKSSGSFSVNGNDTMRSFPTTQDATNFLNAFNKTNYNLTSTNYTSDATSNAYYDATGHYPSVYKAYSYTGGSVFGGSVKLYAITQYDNIVTVGKASITL
jgi:outer membrane murein-binding lipoprotein Lpp